MEAFISNHQKNKIFKLMKDYQSILKFNSDQMIVSAMKDITWDAIREIFNDQYEVYASQIDIEAVNSSEDVNRYLERIEAYTYSVSPIDQKQIQKLFKKEKKLRIPKMDKHNRSFYGWSDEGKKKIYIIYQIEDKLLGMVCCIGKLDASNTRMCSICGHMSDYNEVVPVSVKCKTEVKEQYHVIGFNICKDSDECNNRIVSLQGLESLIKKVNGLVTDDKCGN